MVNFEAAVVRRLLRVWALGTALIGAGCGSSSPTQPAPPPTSLASVAVSGWLGGLAVGQVVQLSATATWTDGSTRSVTTEATWQSSDPTVAIVSSSGLVLAEAPGGVTVRATFQTMSGGLSLAIDGASSPSGPLAGLTCGTERWAVKTLSDPAASAVDVVQTVPSTVRALNLRTAHCDGGPNTRTHPEEFAVYEVVGQVTYVRFEDDRDYHIAIGDPLDPTYTMVTEVADIACQGATSSPRRALIESARNQFISLLGGRPASALLGTTVRVRGVGFFDFNHGQTGRSRNCMELHPVLSITQAQ